MKIKFISKKQRQQLNNTKCITHQQQETKKIQYLNQIKQGKNKIQCEGQNKNTQFPKQIINQKKNQQTSHSKNYNSDFSVGGQYQNNQILRNIQKNQIDQTSQPRQRSRDIKSLNTVTKQQLDQRDIFKKKYLGLLKQQKSKRLAQNYKRNFLFQWNNQDDTFQQGGYLGNTVRKANQKYGHKLQEQRDFQKIQQWKNKSYEQMTQRDWRIFRQDNEIYIKGGRVPTPIRQWNECQLNPILLQNFKELKYQKPRPIQMQAITIGFQMKDLIAIAPTGQGKTIAYLLPIINFVLPLQRITGVNSEKGPYALILAPSRQLAEQIQSQFIKVAKGLNLESIRLVGGKQIQIQSLSLWKGADIIVGTPGRIKQMLQKRHLSLERLSWVVIDEADKMISQNLSQQIEFIMENSSSQSVVKQHLQREKVIHMFSATMVPQIQKLVKTYLQSNPSYITIGQPGGGKKSIQQFVQLIDEHSKSQKLGKILRRLMGPIIIFVNERDSCQPLVKRIAQRWNRTVSDYHGGKSQQVRQKVINMFRNGKIQILVATDLAGRGLDVKGINAVINYDAPKNISEFIHRSGRTGRAGMKGKCYTLLTAADQNIFYDIKVFLERNQFDVPENLKNHPAALVKLGQVAKIPKKKQIIYTN